MTAISKQGRALRALLALLALALVLAACGDDGDDVAADDPTETPAGDPTDDPAGDPTDDPADDPTDDPADEPAGDPVVMEMVVFSPPSLGAFLPAIIEAEEFDLQHGIDLQFVERPPDAYNTEFSTGQFELGGSASLMSEAVRVSQGVDVVYLFNVHDYWATVVSTTDEVTSLPDLEGRDLAAVTGSTSYAMFRWFALQEGLDLDNVEVLNTGTPGLATQALTGRVAAVQMWEPGFSTLMAMDEASGLSEVEIGLGNWEQEFGFSDIPYLGVAAHRAWVDEHQDMIPALQAVYEDAAEWALANPEAAAAIIAATLPDGGDSEEPLADLLADNDRLGLSVRSAESVADGIRAVFEAGVEIGYFETPPSDDVIYMPGQ